MTAERVIAQAMKFDHLPTANAKRIVEALADAGYEIVPSTRSRLLETERVFSE